jgi:hypothetical protein
VFLHDNGPAYQTFATQKIPEYLGFECLAHSLYFPDLALSDYHLFPALEKKLKGRHFPSKTEVIVAGETWLDGQISECLFEWLAKLRATS